MSRGAFRRVCAGLGRKKERLVWHDAGRMRCELFGGQKLLNREREKGRSVVRLWGGLRDWLRWVLVVAAAVCAGGQGQCQDCGARWVHDYEMAHKERSLCNFCPCILCSHLPLSDPLCLFLCPIFFLFCLIILIFPFFPNLCDLFPFFCLDLCLVLCFAVSLSLTISLPLPKIALSSHPISSSVSLSSSPSVCAAVHVHLCICFLRQGLCTPCRCVETKVAKPMQGECVGKTETEFYSGSEV